MAWTNPLTWAVGQLVTAAQLNTHIRDNMLETAPAKVAAAGDLVYGTAANAITRLAIGGAGSILRVSGGLPGWLAVGAEGTQLRIQSGVPAWAETPMCAVYRSSQSISPGGGAVNIAFNSEQYDPYNMHDNVTNNDRVTIPSGCAGTYLVLYDCTASSNPESATGQFLSSGICNLGKNGGGVAGGFFNVVYGNPSVGSMGIHVTPMVAGDYFSIWINNFDDDAISHSVHMYVQRIGA